MKTWIGRLILTILGNMLIFGLIGGCVYGVYRIDASKWEKQAEINKSIVLENNGKAKCIAAYEYGEGKYHRTALIFELKNGDRVRIVSNMLPVVGETWEIGLDKWGDFILLKPIK